MTVKDKLLAIFEKNNGKRLSGQFLSYALKCSRTAVWKGVNALRAEGYVIDGVNKVGYTLISSADILSEGYVTSLLKKDGVNIPLKTYKTVDSTNTLLKRMVQEGETRDLVVCADEQTAGRGRRGRSFYSPSGSGLYISFLLHPDMPVAEAVRLTTVAAVAVSESVEQVCDVKTKIKWVNDVLVNGKKICGILTEAQTSLEEGKLDHVIVGIGINLSDPEGGFPEDIKDIAGSVLGDKEHPGNLKNNFLSALIVRFMKYYSEMGQKTYLKAYRERSICIGKDVLIVTPDHEKIKTGASDRSHAFVIGLDDECRLHVRYKDGKEEYLSSGEVSLKL